MAQILPDSSSLVICALSTGSDHSPSQSPVPDPQQGTLDSLLMQVLIRELCVWLYLDVLRGTWIYSSLAGRKSLDSNQESHYIPFKTLRLSTNLYQIFSDCLRLNKLISLCSNHGCTTNLIINHVFACDNSFVLSSNWC